MQKNLALKYILEILKIYKGEKVKIENARYHHNSDYKDAISIGINGVLSLASLVELGFIDMKEEQLNRYSDTTSHINGINGVSLSVVGLTDLYKDEFEYDPFIKSKVDVIIDSSVKAHRDSTNYGNEYVTDEDINVNFIRSIDIRLEEYINEIINAKDIKKIDVAVKKFNYLIDIAIVLKEKNILLREASYGQNKILDKDKISELKKIITL